MDMDSSQDHGTCATPGPVASNIGIGSLHLQPRSVSGYRLVSHIWAGLAGDTANSPGVELLLCSAQADKKLGTISWQTFPLSAAAAAAAAGCNASPSNKITTAGCWLVRGSRAWRKYHIITITHKSAPAPSQHIRQESGALQPHT